MTSEVIDMPQEIVPPDIEAFYQSLKTADICRDMAGHLDLLRQYAMCCARIVELGCHDMTSAWAFLLGRPRSLNCFDKERQPEVDAVERAALELRIEFTFHRSDSRVCYIPECDLLHIDTWHTGDHVYAELNRHHGQVRRYILMHDTITYQWKTGDGIGMWWGIGKFLREHPEWNLSWTRDNDNGMTLLTRR